MTGFGKAEAILEGGRLRVEIRSLNGKNADITLKTPLIPKDREMDLRRKVAEVLVRGNIDIFLTWEPSATAASSSLDTAAAMAYFGQLREMATSSGLPDPAADSLGTATLIASALRMPEVVTGGTKEIITDENWPLVDAAFDEALAAIDAFRVKEGAVLRDDLAAKVDRILDFSKQVEAFEKERTEAVREKILARFEELQLSPDPSRLEQEMIFYLEKLDINEERVRLRQHCKYFMETLDGAEHPGRKLGFIAQEMGREINTTGSKANHGEMQRLVTCMKDELEKIKEQTLNIL